MSNRIRPFSSHPVSKRLGITLMLALMLLMQSITLQASVEMLPHHLALAHGDMGCIPGSDCDNAMSKADCCAQASQHCGSGLCSVALIGLPVTQPMDRDLVSVAPDSRVVTHISEISAPPSPPPKAI